MPTSVLRSGGCAVCCSRGPGARMRDVDGETVCLCDECVSRLDCCDHCRRPSRRLAVTYELQRLCRRCSSEWLVCVHCGYHTPPGFPTDTGGHACPLCARRLCDYCHRCGRYSAAARYVSGGDRACQRCATEFFDSCPDCGTLVPRRGVCDTCHRFPHVRGYGYRPDPLFFGAGPLFLGLELEIVVPEADYDDCVARAYDRLGPLGYLKEDSSIRPLGFELVTHPMSYGFALTEFPWPLLEELADLGCVSDERVGLHVHASRAGFASPAHIYRWAKLVYRNQEQTVTLARRHSTRYAGFSADARARIKDSAKGDLSRFGLNRYQAINPHPRHTLELRVFAGSLDTEQVQAALAFTAASIEYTRLLSAADVLHHDGWVWTRFAEWVAARPDYAPLSAQMEALGCAC
ncbi:amidoligase family protein [Nocardia sp. CDC159]|uniref:Amidoligase family protein n=1 Tax=Nocardia pulmonis TaxID=2951408 RepID=A0A9X2EA17_9NOCA|nr:MULTISPECIES: amidoligase family protein [Nocardia]MCM6774541.1 amidoligase family protein [Nocardia pulmonis]MCM6787393.1 amidoligase family protein [Nocardia sp. CDC159]